MKRFHYDNHDQLHAPCRLHGSLLLRPTAQDARRPQAIPIHLQDLDFRARAIHPQSDPPDAGTEQLNRRTRQVNLLKPFSNFFSEVTARKKETRAVPAAFHPTLCSPFSSQWTTRREGMPELRADLRRTKHKGQMCGRSCRSQQGPDCLLTVQNKPRPLAMCRAKIASRK